MSKYFKPKEMACKCGCGFDKLSERLYFTLDIIRDYIDRPIIVNSACRCAKHNQAVGGVKNSQHVQGRAADIRAKDMTAGTLWQKIKELHGMGRLPYLKGLGRYDNFVHVDVRDAPKLVEFDYRKRK